MQWREFNKEVLYVDENLAQISQAEIEILKQKALANERKRIRLCFHKDVADSLHEMLIIHTKDTYVRPHQHFHKSESFHVLEGRADIVIFDEQGNVTQVIAAGEYSSGRTFYCCMAAGCYHTLIIHSDFLVFYETTKGPFLKSDTGLAPWSPEESDLQGCREYIQKLTALTLAHS